MASSAMVETPDLDVAAQVAWVAPHPTPSLSGGAAASAAEAAGASLPSMSPPLAATSAADTTASQQQQQQAPESELPAEPLDLLAYDSAAALAALPLDRLKGALLALGMKCGGTAAQRADRLWGVRGVAPPDIPPQLLASSGRGGGGRKRQ